MARIGIIQHLQASHGSSPHKHLFKIEFVVAWTIKEDFVEGLDFHDLIAKIEHLLEPLRGTYLPESLGLKKASVENIAIYFFKQLTINNLYTVTVREDTDRYATIYAQDIK